MSNRVLIVGGGVSGLATAYHLSRYAIPCTIVEKSHRTGGLIQTDLIEGCRLEAGPDSCIATKPAFTELAEELGLKEKIIGSNNARQAHLCCPRWQVIAYAARHGHDGAG